MCSLNLFSCFKKRNEWTNPPGGSYRSSTTSYNSSYKATPSKNYNSSQKIEDNNDEIRRCAAIEESQRMERDRQRRQADLDRASHEQQRLLESQYLAQRQLAEQQRREQMRQDDMRRASAYNRRY